MLIRLGDVLRIPAPHCSILLSQTDVPASRLLTIRAIFSV